MNIKPLLVSVLVLFSMALPASAQNLFSPYVGKTMVFKGKGVSSGRSFTIKGKISACNGSESGICLGDFPLFNKNFALVFQGDQVQERIQLSVANGKLAARMNYVNPQGGVDDSVPLTIRLRK